MPFGRVELVEAFSKINGSILPESIHKIQSLRVSNPRSSIVPSHAGILPLELYKLFESAPSDLKRHLLDSFNQAFSELRKEFHRIQLIIESLKPIPASTLTAFISAWMLCENIYFTSLENKASAELNIIAHIQTSIQVFRKNRQLEVFLPEPHNHEQLNEGIRALGAILANLHIIANIALNPDKQIKCFESNLLLLAELVASSPNSAVSGLSKYNLNVLQKRADLLKSNSETWAKARDASHRLLNSFNHVLNIFEQIGDSFNKRFPQINQKHFPEIVEALHRFVTEYVKASVALRV